MDLSDMKKNLEEDLTIITKHLEGSEDFRDKLIWGRVVPFPRFS